MFSPLLFNLNTLDLNELNNESTSIIQHADDVCIYSWHEDINSLINNMAEVKQWLHENCFDYAKRNPVLFFSQDLDLRPKIP